MLIPAYITKKVDNVLKPVVKLFYESGLRPIHLIFFAFFLSLAAALLFHLQKNSLGFFILVLSLFFDALESSMARVHSITSKKGEMQGIISDRISEFLIFAALTLNGSVGITLALLAYYAIILNTLLMKRANIDLGFKRSAILLGYFIRFDVVFTIIFFVNLVSFMIQLLVLDYKHTKSIQKAKADFILK